MSEDSIDPSRAYYFNTETGEVEHGLVSDFVTRMGPYRTRAEAENALETAAARNKRWDEQDKAWDDDEDEG